jgi:DNA-binding IclR family transcriptional regulator
MSENDNSASAVQGIDRTAAVLRAIGRGHRSGVRLIDIAAATGLSKATVHRIINGLLNVGFVEQDEISGLFFLSFDMLMLGVAASNRNGLVECASEEMVRLEKLTNDTIYLVARSGTDALCVYRVEGSYPIKVLTFAIGDVRPLGVGAASMSLLAFYDDDEIGRIISANAEKLAAFPGFSPSDMLSIIENARKKGFVTNEGRYISEMFAVGVPIRNHNGCPIAGLSLAAIKSRLQPARLDTVIPLLQAAAKKIEVNIEEISLGVGNLELKTYSAGRGRRASNADDLDQTAI